MNLYSVGSTLAQAWATREGTPSPIQGDLRSLANALRAGDLSSAQKALATLAQHVSGQSPSELSTDLQAVAGALKTGDLDGARKALGALFQHIHSRYRPLASGVPPTDPAAATGGDGAAPGTTTTEGTLNLRV